MTGSGTIEDGNYKLKIGKKVVKDGNSINITAGEEIPIQLKGTKGAKFKGFLFRLSGDGVDTESLIVKGIKHKILIYVIALAIQQAFAIITIR